MINIKNNNWQPSPGFKYLTNGSVWSESIYLGKHDSIDNWHDTNDEPPAPEEEPNNDEYKSALQILLGERDGDL